ncbi:CYT2 [Candida oxycetoniae]|uniref:Holocytochrome c-type synthase n=1 Tax=Candida oxycetoniae TaxID=497107 RepID=A0AAI9STG1_9ASCO|nr:CYT2 [Candida oxycetoniae]KAI3402731.2 CYT2 [Candida oxycetoniae]
MAVEDEQAKCPVDFTTGSTWISKLIWKPKKGSEVPLQRTNFNPDNEPFSNQDQPVCPVDHKSRQAWLDKVSVNVITTDAIEETPISSKTCDSSAINNTLQDTTISNVDLPTEREISSIPRTASNMNWIYPSQKQFFEAMQRKNWNPESQDMKVIVPIHNLVNERAWKHIMMWESPNCDKAMKECGGITLTSFKGDSKRLTPRAWFKSKIAGQEPPFDRHDWTINRCGVEVEYVIDFYNGENNQVWLDVRPKLNSLEGCKLRILRAIAPKTN